MPTLLLVPALLAGAASAAWAADPRGPAGRWLALGAAVAAGAVAGLAPSGARDASWLLLGARTGVDPAGRLVLLAAAGLLLWALRGRGAASAGAAPAWRALVAGGLCASAVALDAGLLALGHVALLFACYGLAVQGPDGQRAATRFMAAAVIGEVLLVDALAEFGHAAESAHLDVMRAVAARELGPAAPVLLAAAFGLPVLFAGLGRLVEPAAVLAAVGALAISRLVGTPAGLRAGDAALPFLGLAALAAAGGLLGRTALARWHREPAPGSPGRAGDPARHAGAGPAASHQAPTGAAPGAARHAWLDVAEARLGRGAGSGLLLLALVAALVAALSLGLAPGR